MDNNWRLDSIKLDFQTWGENKGKYAGSVRFENGDYESFSFKIRPDMAQPYINLIASDVVKGADALAQRLCVSLGLKENKDEDSIAVGGTD
jgi:hypothetical protein